LALVFSVDDGEDFRVDSGEREHECFGTGGVGRVNHGAFPF
jgi:hypothetical protein